MARYTLSISVDHDLWQAFKARCDQLRHTPSREIEHFMKIWLEAHATASDTLSAAVSNALSGAPLVVYEGHTHRCPFCDTYYDCGCDDKGEIVKACDDEDCIRQHPIEP